VHNLCAAASYEHMLAYHILDSLSVAANLDLANQQILDVGTGAGLPGVPLAIVIPSCQITLLDAKEKKISFIQHAINTLQLTNITAINSRIENYQPQNKFNLVISRAFASLDDFVKLAARLCSEEGKLITMKSNSKEFSVNTVIADNYQIVEIKKLVVPGIASERCLVIVR
jgi:16S rRNA (guanine527-N7)-methyltransferase